MLDVKADVLEADAAVRPELHVLRVVPGEALHSLLRRDVCSLGTHWHLAKCAQECAQTRPEDHHPAANANQVPNKKRAEISKIQARSLIPGSLSKPPHSAALPPHRER
jgi:hypothetical protein